MRTRRLFFALGGNVLALAIASGGMAMAQDAQPGATGTGSQGLNSGGVLAPTGGAVDKGQGGVGGTGLGKMPSGSGQGTGMSVKGPAGQGIQPMQQSK